MQTDKYIKANGGTIYPTAKEPLNRQQAKYTKEISLGEKNRDKVNTSGQTAPSMKENGSTIRWKDKELSAGQTGESTKDNGKII